VFFVCTLVLTVLLLPDVASAWGPITHLAHGSQILAHTTTLRTGLQQLLGQFRQEYLYGCVGADMVFGKKFTRAMHAHCHEWVVGWAVLHSAKSGPQQAFAYGYLSHLAADVFSHNHFVPTQLVLSYESRALGHAYWEARFDTMQDVRYRQLVSGIRKRSFPECDRLAKRVVARTIFSFRTNKRIFNSVLAFHDWANWYGMMGRVASRSRHDLDSELVARYNALCHAAIIDVLRHGEGAKCQKADPIGINALSQAKDLRHTLRALQRRGAMSSQIEEDLQVLSRREDLGGSRARRGIARAPG
jgi:hypothetical protein